MRQQGRVQNSRIMIHQIQANSNQLPPPGHWLMKANGGL